METEWRYIPDYRTVVENNQAVVCYLHGTQDDANKRGKLIAAAPEMREELQVCKENRRDLARNLTQLMKQRNELLAALKDAYNWIDDAANLYPSLESDEIMRKIEQIILYPNQEA